jgi:hypothetical protein
MRKKIRRHGKRVQPYEARTTVTNSHTKLYLKTDRCPFQRHSAAVFFGVLAFLGLAAFGFTAFFGLAASFFLGLTYTVRRTI